MKKLVPGLVIGALMLGSSAVVAQDEPPPVVGDRLAQIQERGTLICGVNGQLAGFSVLDEATGDYIGIDADYCRAVAQAVLGDATAVDFRPVTAVQRGPSAAERRDRRAHPQHHQHHVARRGLGQLHPDDLLRSPGHDGRRSTAVSPRSQTSTAPPSASSPARRPSRTWSTRWRSGHSPTKPLVNDQTDAVYQAYEEGRCDAVTSDQSQLAARRSSLTDPSAHLILDESISKEPLGPVVPHGDEQWFNIVNWVVNVTIDAEELDITPRTWTEMPEPATTRSSQRLLGVTGDVGAQAGSGERLGRGRHQERRQLRRDLRPPPGS